MSAILFRTKSDSFTLACMKGHRAGYRELNGGVKGMSGHERDFRYRMHELCGAAQHSINGPDGEMLLKAGWVEIWRSIYGLHEFFGKTNRIDDLIGLLLMARKAWLREVPDAARLELLRDSLDAMARQPHTVDLMLDLGEKLETAGVDLKSGF